MLPWWFWIVIFILDLFLVCVGWRCGARVERSKQASREEAIRLQAYKDGRLSMAGTMVDGWPDYGGHGIPLTPDEYRRMYQGTLSTDKPDETREGC